MEKINLNLDQLLRYYFAGAIGVIAWCFLSSKLELCRIENYSFMFLILPLLIGSIVYSVHRALIYPILYLILFLLIRLFIKDKGDIQDAVCKRDFRRWEQKKNPNSYQHDLMEWASQVHFIYCSSWAVLCSLIISHYSFQCNNSFWVIFKIVLTVLFVAGVIHHIRFIIYDNLSVEEDRKFKKPSKDL